MKIDLPGDYWNRKYRELQDTPTHALIRSLRSQLDTCNRIALETRGSRDVAGLTEALQAIAFHAAHGSGLKQIGVEPVEGEPVSDDESLFDSEP